jgi:hypothetical protein
MAVHAVVKPCSFSPEASVNSTVLDPLSTLTVGGAGQLPKLATRLRRFAELASGTENARALALIAVSDAKIRDSSIQNYDLFDGHIDFEAFIMN